MDLFVEVTESATVDGAIDGAREYDGPLDGARDPATDGALDGAADNGRGMLAGNRDSIGICVGLGVSGPMSSSESTEVGLVESDALE